jgi:hypothetical protein
MTVFTFPDLGIPTMSPLGDWGTAVAVGRWHSNRGGVNQLNPEFSTFMVLVMAGISLASSSVPSVSRSDSWGVNAQVGAAAWHLLWRPCRQIPQTLATSRLSALREMSLNRLRFWKRIADQADGSAE